jgi:putative ABC transport system permease protein
MEGLLKDFNYGVRMLLKKPGFTAIAVTTLALGIGANTAIFSVVNAVLLSSLPFPDADRVATVTGRRPAGSFGGLSTMDIEDLQQQGDALEAISPMMMQSVNLTGIEKPDRIRGGFVSWNFFTMLGAQPASGRAFAEGEDRPGAEQVVVLDHKGWVNRFGADPKIVGRTLMLNGEPFTVVGIMPAEFRFPMDEIEVWMPAHKYPSYKPERSAKNFFGVARIREGVTLEEAQARLAGVAKNLAESYPENEGLGVEVKQLREALVSHLRSSLYLLLGAVGFVLLIACANTANLLLARGADRQREIAVRMALGAGRKRVVRQLLTESVVLATLGGFVGMMLAWWGISAIASLEIPIPLLGPIEVDGRVLAFNFVVAAVTGILFGIAPAFQLSKADLNEALKSGRTSGGLGRHRARSTFVVVQVALSLVLLVGSGLLIRSFAQLLQVDPGFDSRNLLSMEYRLPRNKYSEEAGQAAFHLQVAEQVRQVPGVVSAAVVNGLPFSGNGYGAIALLPDQEPPPKGQEPRAITLSVSPGYFETMRIPLLSGRLLADTDGPESLPVILVNKTMVKKYWGDADPIGKQVHFPEVEMTATVVGIVGDAKHYALDEEQQPQAYVSYAQDPGIFATLVARTNGDPMSYAAAVREAVWSVDSEQPVWKIRSVESLIERDVAIAKQITSLMTIFGFIALTLAALGIYGVISYSVSQRTQEIGVRMALGAGKGDVLRLVVGGGFVLTLIGIVVGVAASLGLSQLMSGLLFGVSPTDPLTFVLVPAILAAVAFVACYVPARRAARVEPTVALRYE